MCATDRESLESEVRALPALLRAALERRMRCAHHLAQLKEQLSALEEEEATLNEDEEDSWGPRGKVALARQALEEAKAEADLRVRQTLQERTGRVTEARIRAEVTADPEVQRLRRELIALEEEQRSPSARRSRAAPHPRRLELQAQIAAAEQKVELAAIDVHVAEAKMEMYRILVMLLGALAWAGQGRMVQEEEGAVVADSGALEQLRARVVELARQYKRQTQAWQAALEAMLAAARSDSTSWAGKGQGSAGAAATT
jgi:hypothetical protein